MSDSAQPVFLVDAYADPVVVRIEGRASFLNSAAVKEFFTAMVGQGKTRFAVDFKACASMDSTFLGVLAGAAIQLRKLNPPGSLTLVRVGERNLELIRNLGLHRLATVDTGGTVAEGAMNQLDARKLGEIENARLVLEAHENLVATDPENATKFQDVLAFLRNQLGSR
ncbi:anti-sigma factor antagonist [Oleiharenicola lentus]|jgi:anti-anti-sigma factor|uniref:Anti-sigma factor antagonist n=1 Tax=Oleiharenicola lentus TaxID=2508720 RepID=A0A4Q1CCC9_9BACT|nr:STAS domain-containing protein [Oleiharenicola lentus]RXK56572.1 anti-sigma factor antagonist [Oleiharenicola lentus]